MSEIAPAPAPPSPPLSGQPRTGSFWLGVLLLVAGGAWLLSALGLLDLGFQTGVGLLLIGIGIVVALDAGRSHGVLVTLAVILSLLGAAATWVDVDLFDGGVGDRTVVPASATAPSAGYKLAIGKLTLELTALSAVADGPSVPVKASVGIGQLHVTVPQDANVEVDAHVSMGNINTLGISHGGVDVDDHSELAGTGARITLDANVGIGEVLITRAP